MGNSRRLNLRLRSVVMSFANILVTLFLVTPLAFTFLAAIQTEKSLVEVYTRLIPTEFTTQNLEVLLFGREDILKDTGMYHLPKIVFQFMHSFRNSLTIAITTTLLNLIIGSMAAYAIARLPARWTKGFMFINLASRMVPLMVLMIPLFVTMRQLKLLNTLTGTIVALTGFLLPYTIWILYSFFISLPAELEDAARVDGCSRFGTFLRIILPLSAPGVAAAGAIVFILSWNEFFIPFVVSSKPDAMPVPVLIASLISDWHVYYTLASAGVILGVLPSVVLGFLLQRYVVRGLTAGALKG
jgi:multiple sugar transport system permease protein